LSVEDWTSAALRALAVGGLRAVAIEPLAASLGATKGSGYWHFANRAQLVSATLDRWEREHTAAVIAQVERAASPEVRLRDLFTLVMAHAGPNSVELALLASASDPLVAAALQRVTDRRLDYLTRLFIELGFDEPASRHRALLAYTTYLGHAQLSRIAPSAVPVGQDRTAHLQTVLTALLRH
jgi:AcrR family transcriptional regulator